MPRAVSSDEVLAAVIELSARYHAPGTSLITRHLASDRPVSGALQTAVHDVLRHLEADGRVSCVVHRGTHRWSPNHNHRECSDGSPP